MNSWSSGSWNTMPTRRRISGGSPWRPAARDRDGPGAGGEDAVEVQHQRGLAGAVGAEQRDPLAARGRAGRRRTAPGGRRGRRRRGRGPRGPGARHVRASGRCSRGDSIARWTRSPRSYERMNSAPADAGQHRPVPRVARGEAAGLAGDPHPPHLGGDHVEVADHERHDLDEQVRQPQPLAARRSRSCGSVVAARVRLASTPRVPLASSAPARPAARLADARGRGRRPAGPVATNGSSSAKTHERHLDHHPLARCRPAAPSRPRPRRASTAEVGGERREPVLRRGDHDQHEAEQGEQLEVRRRAVHRRVAVDSAACGRDRRPSVGPVGSSRAGGSTAADGVGEPAGQRAATSDADDAGDTAGSRRRRRRSAP